MTPWLNILNAAAVGLFGSLLSAAFCDVTWNRRNRLFFVGCLLFLGVLQAALYKAFDLRTIQKLYPFITHLPLMLLLGYLSRKPIWSVVAVLSAYLCCQLRRWLALFCVAIFSGGESMQLVVELIVTLPLMLLLLRFAAPAVRSMSHLSRGMHLQFGLIPVINYLFDYITRIYTTWLVDGIPAAVEFMPFVCSAAYLIFVLYSTSVFRHQNELEQTQAVLNLQVHQAGNQLAEMKKSQEQAAAYRHDLRHHLQYLSVCIDSGALDQAQEYIRTLNEEITQQEVTRYCENTAVNLILSAYSTRAAEKGIELSVRLRVGQLVRISENDLCVLLSNALENALHACTTVRLKGQPALIRVNGFEKDNQLLLEVTNTCLPGVVFENDLPVARQKGHGIGVKSICAVAEKYGGIHVFEEKNGLFILRLSL